jgi:transcriptional regulator with XRE-family HTH domain
MVPRFERRVDYLRGNGPAADEAATVAAMTTATLEAGQLLRTWRERRRLTQLELSVRAEVSARHLSFVETGRSTPSRDMVLHLAEHLDVPLRERNALLVAAGYAPVYAERALDAPDMTAVRTAIDRLLASHEPYPAVVVDRWWTLVAGNTSVGVLTDGVADHLLAPPANVLRASLHPEGLAPRIRNLGEWRAHLLTRLRGQVERTADPRLAALLEELRGYGRSSTLEDAYRYDGVAVPLRLRTPHGDLNFLSTVATFGTAVDVTLADLSIESFFPADDATRARLQASPLDTIRSISFD